MTKKYLNLTEDQKKRGVVFSSQLQPSSTIHEVFATDKDKDTVVKRLLDDSFFNNSPYKFNEIRQ